MCSGKNVIGFVVNKSGFIPYLITFNHTQKLFLILACNAVSKIVVLLW